MVPFDRLGPTWLILSRSFWDPFHNPFRNIILSSIAVLNSMTFVHTIVARDEDCNIVRNKARLVVKCYIQEEGVDFYETYEPFARLKVVRLL